MQMQLDIPEELNRKLKIIKVKRDFDNLKEVVINLLIEATEKENV